MTTEFKYSLVPNINYDENWPMFSARLNKTVADLSVLTIAIQHPGIGGIELQTWLAAKISSLLSEVSFCFSSPFNVFISNSTLIPDTRISRHKKLWGSNGLSPVPKNIAQNLQFEMRCSKGLRFSAIATVNRLQTDWLASSILNFPTVTPIFSNQLTLPDQEKLQHMTHAAFPPDGCGEVELLDRFDWPSFSTWCCQNGYVCFRRNLFSDNSNFEFDLFGGALILKDIHQKILLSKLNNISLH